MRILVVSDSHGQWKRIKEIVDMLSESVQAVIHLGDVYSDKETVERFFPNIPFYGIDGNCDFHACGEEEKIIELGGKRIFFTHGHRYGVKAGILNIAYRAKEVGANICLFGHTHVPLLWQDDELMVMNPGSVYFPRGAYEASYGIIHVEANGNINGSVVEITKNGYRPIEF